jgi:SAM-dependent methyltransferase
MGVNRKVRRRPSEGTLRWPPAVRARWDPHARALLAYESGDEEATLTVIDDLGDEDRLPVSWFFRSGAGMPPLERLALALCRGRVLDLGAGAGSHALALQKRRLAVTAVEILPEIVELLLRRGVVDAREGSLRDPPSGRWDTLLLLMNGWGLAETLSGLEQFLSAAQGLLAPGGRIIADSTDMRPFATGIGGTDRSEAIREDGRYVGEIQFQLEFDGRRGDPFSYLYVDPDTLARVAGGSGWTVEIAGRGPNGAFLSVLRRSGECAEVVIACEHGPTGGSEE